jgi:hypothetical protein
MSSLPPKPPPTGAHDHAHLVDRPARIFASMWRWWVMFWLGECTVTQPSGST